MRVQPPRRGGGRGLLQAPPAELTPGCDTETRPAAARPYPSGSGRAGPDGGSPALQLPSSESCIGACSAAGVSYSGPRTGLSCHSTTKPEATSSGPRSGTEGRPVALVILRRVVTISMLCSVSSVDEPSAWGTLLPPHSHPENGWN